MDQRALVEIRC